MQESVVLYWQPGCTSCLRAKEFLKANGVDFKSINVAEDPDKLEELGKHGIQSVPVLRRGNSFLYAQVLREMAEFLHIKSKMATPLPIEILVTRLDVILTAAQRYILQVPDSCLSKNLPGRKRTVRELSYHIFHIAECFIRATSGTPLDDNELNAPPGNGLRTTKDLATYGKNVMKAVQNWWDVEPHATGSETLSTYFGPQTLQTVMERTAWHSAQHTRQLMMVLDNLGIEPKEPLTPASLSGLPLPTNVWDS
tara:strand:+ start:146 stop:904 length:759 start_codon:yes stop_codon:yes gene_type:complete